MAVPDWKDFSGKGYLGQLQTYVSNNAKNYGIVFANDIAGHRTVPTKVYLASIPDPLLSASKNNTDNDAIGQLWYVPGDGYYQLKDWATRHNENLSAWEKIKIPTAAEFESLISNMFWKPAVNTYADIATTYPTPVEGWTVSCKDTNFIYRYDDATKTWINIFQFSGALSQPSSATGVGGNNGLQSALDKYRIDSWWNNYNEYINGHNIITENEEINTVYLNSDGTSTDVDISNLSAQALRYIHPESHPLDILRDLNSDYKELLKQAPPKNYLQFFYDNGTHNIPLNSFSNFSSKDNVYVIFNTDIKVEKVNDYLYISHKNLISAHSSQRLGKFSFDNNGHITGFTEVTDVSENVTLKDLVIQLNGGVTEGTNKFTYNGKTAKTINITPASISAANSVHNHTTIISVGRKDASDLASTWAKGVQMGEVYNNGYPELYGNVLTLNGAGTSQIFVTWNANSNGVAGENLQTKIYLRSRRDNMLTWTAWKQVALIDDISWTNLSGKPTSFTPAAHTHNYAGSNSAGGAANSVANSLKIQLNGGTTEGTNQFTFNGSAVKTVNITPANIGAATSNHNHATLAHHAVYGDIRDVATTPNNYNGIFKSVGMKTRTIMGVGTTTYVSGFGWRGWTDSTGGNAWEIFGDNSRLYARSGATTTWNAWETIAFKSDLTGLATSTHSHAWADITGKPTSFTPAAHNHAASNITSGTLDKARMPAKVAYLDTAQEWTAYQNFTSGAGNSGSDMRFKQNVKLIKPVLDKLMKLDIISYIWEKEGEQKRDTFGINANQLKNLHGIFEKIIHERNDEDKTLWVEYDRFGVLAIKGIQEIERKRQNDKQQLLNKIQNQVRRIESLEKENQTLRRKQKDLENRIKKIELLLR